MRKPNSLRMRCAILIFFFFFVLSPSLSEDGILTDFSQCLCLRYFSFQLVYILFWDTPIEKVHVTTSEFLKDLFQFWTVLA